MNFHQFVRKLYFMLFKDPENSQSKSVIDVARQLTQPPAKLPVRWDIRARHYGMIRRGCKSRI